MGKLINLKKAAAVLLTSVTLMSAADGQSAASAYRNIAKRLQGERVPLLRIR